MHYDTIIGIDPGSNGGIAVDNCGDVQIFKMPENISEVSDILANFPGALVFIEKLSVRYTDVNIKDGMGKLFRLQKMIANFEQLKAAIEIAGMEYVQVHPMTWQSGLGLRIKDEPKPARKKRYKDVAAKVFPNLRVAMWNCDALLIMVFGGKAVAERPKWVAGNLPKKKIEKISSKK